MKVFGYGQPNPLQPKKEGFEYFYHKILKENKRFS